MTIKFEQLNNVTRKVVKFVEIKNKWKYIPENFKCCENNCISTNKPGGVCINGNGFVNLISDEYIRYYNCVEGKGKDIGAAVHVVNQFKKPQNCFNYSLFHFEIKCKIERELNNWMVIGVCNTKSFKFNAKNCAIVNEKNEEIKLSTFSWNDNDVFGCGLVYPPTMVNEFPYIFFTQNGKQIGKALLLKDNFDYYEPYVILRCCSVETNFGNNLETKPFIYDISKYFVCKEFY
ncbi:unnamed protein product [Meloidogyne enterolobii]|uniref:Uncharacterized protein n=1 Tax=Meloidogyne enterolobii TaxID=390850 RepID=A0ACB0YLA6_MELEN